MRISALGASGAPKRYDPRLDPADVLIKVKLVRWHDFRTDPRHALVTCLSHPRPSGDGICWISPTGLLFFVVPLGSVPEARVGRI